MLLEVGISLNKKTWFLACQKVHWGCTMSASGKTPTLYCLVTWGNTCVPLSGPAEESVLGVHRGARERWSIWDRWGRGGDLRAWWDVAYAVGSRRWRWANGFRGWVGLVSWWAGRLLWFGSIAPVSGVWTVVLASGSSYYLWCCGSACVSPRQADQFQVLL